MPQPILKGKNEEVVFAQRKRKQQSKHGKRGENKGFVLSLKSLSIMRDSKEREKNPKSSLKKTSKKERRIEKMAEQRKEKMQVVAQGATSRRLYRLLKPGVEIFHSEDLSLPHDRGTFFFLYRYTRQGNQLRFEKAIVILETGYIAGYRKVRKVIAKR